MQRLLLALAVATVSVSAMAADVGVTVRVGQPNFYGRIDIGDMPRPQVVYAQPIVVQPAPQGVIGQPIYLRVPPGHAKHWNKHCQRYNACGQPVYFVQAPREVLMIWQGDHQVRHVYLNAQHSKNPKPSWYGESVGHYEGDTLVVDTIGISEKTLVDNFATPHTAQLHTVERYRMSDDHLRLEVKLHVEDPGAFTTPWDAMQRYRRVEPHVAEFPKASGDLLSAIGDAGPMLESSCAENPHGLFDAPGTLPIPQAGTPDF